MVVPGLALDAWYIDDGTLVGSSGDLVVALHIIQRDDPSVGLDLNRAKSLLLILEAADASLFPLPPDIPITCDGFTLLECPICPIPIVRMSSEGGLQSLSLLWGLCRIWAILSWSPLSFTRVSPYPRFVSYFAPAPPATSALQLWSLTTLCEMPWKLSWVDPCRIGHGSSYLFPASMVVSTFAVLSSMLLLPSLPHGPDPCS